MRCAQLIMMPVAATLWVFVQACTAPGGPDHIKAGFGPPDAAPSSSSPDGSVRSEGLKCLPVVASQMYLPRSSVTAGQSSSVAPTYFTADLFARFKTVCGGCHVDNNLGNYTVSAADFTQKVTQKTVDQITGQTRASPTCPRRVLDSRRIRSGPPPIRSSGWSRS